MFEGRVTASWRRRRWLLAALTLLLGAVLGLPPVSPASAASNGLWSVFPTTPPGHTPREFFHPQLMPGVTSADSVTVANYTAAPITFHLYGADAVNARGGGLSVRRRTDTQSDIGKWIKLPYPELTVAARSTSVVPFTILPPPEASPGDHVGGIVAEETQGTTSRSGSVPITVLQAVGVRVYGRVVGPLHPRLAVEHLSLSLGSSGATQFDGSVDAHLRFTVANPGNTVLSPVATVELTTPFGAAARRTLTVGQILPGSSLPYALDFPGVSADSHLRATVAVTAPRATATATATAWAVPWALLAVVLIVVVLAIALLVRRRRRGTAPADPEQSSHPVTEGAVGTHAGCGQRERRGGTGIRGLTRRQRPTGPVSPAAPAPANTGGRAPRPRADRRYGRRPR